MRHATIIAITTLIATSSIVAADPWRTTIDVVLRKQPGERQAVVSKLPAGTTVVIEKEEGRWLRVRAGKLVGYLTRTTIADAAPAPAPAPTPTPTPTPAITEADHRGPANRWSEDRLNSTRAGATGLFVVVTAPRGSLFDEPRPTAGKRRDVGRGTRLVVIDVHTPGWIHVRDDGGHEVWIARADVDNSLASAIDQPGSPSAPAKSPAVLLGRPSGLAIRAGAGIGYRSLGMDFTSNGAAGLANYLVSADAAAATVDVDVALPLGRVVIGFDARTQLSTSAPGTGIEYLGPSRAGGKIEFATFALDGGIRVALRRRIFEVAARAGGHYDAFVSKDVENAGKLPREQLFGATVGGRLEITPPTSRIGVGIRIDALVLGAREQTPGLEDGSASSAHALWAGTTIRLALRRRWAANFVYDFARATTSWSGMSIRTPGVTRADRVDSSQVVQIGLSATL
ncbi:MAG: SH3 domain-containing protein [Kofleriaceae bacterium]